MRNEVSARGEYRDCGVRCIRCDSCDLLETPKSEQRSRQTCYSTVSTPEQTIMIKHAFTAATRRVQNAPAGTNHFWHSCRFAPASLSIAIARVRTSSPCNRECMRIYWVAVHKSCIKTVTFPSSSRVMNRSATFGVHANQPMCCTFKPYLICSTTSHTAIFAGIVLPCSTKEDPDRT